MVQVAQSSSKKHPDDTVQRMNLVGSPLEECISLDSMPLKGPEADQLEDPLGARLDPATDSQSTASITDSLDDPFEGMFDDPVKIQKSSELQQINGFCRWNSKDKGSSSVCVTVTEEALQIFTQRDEADFLWAVRPGGQFCINVWAWEAAVSRDPEHAEGLQLKCHATSGELRQVYQDFDAQMRRFLDVRESAGQEYEPSAALKKIDEVCGSLTI
eukprot:gnl/TRDRNA2_/TRDRNA2_167014_c2_seq1.p1 gnl/TRDRNA2_/TRDRNA2_167014_c2~~gnl/TRDRNA2_/TRDRNA2_167014_c2_seq1.p1  ORF type:complete len:231 (+),score=34.16 gnl/TRDRNA2_/TRDRNA2_167014_c2_seq1:49-693(+)